MLTEQWICLRFSWSHDFNNTLVHLCNVLQYSIWANELISFGSFKIQCCLRFLSITWAFFRSALSNCRVRNRSKGRSSWIDSISGFEKIAATDQLKLMWRRRDGLDWFQVIARWSGSDPLLEAGIEWWLLFFHQLTSYRFLDIRVATKACRSDTGDGAFYQLPISYVTVVRI